MTESDESRTRREAGTTNADPIQLIHQTLANLRFGAIQLIVHEGKLVQMEVTEKRRFA